MKNLSAAGLMLSVLISCVSAQDPESNARVLSEYYDPGKVQTVHIRIKDEDRHRLYKALPDRIYVPAEFRWNDTTISNVGVRFKGNSSSNPDQPFKRSYLIKFSEFESGQRFFGLRRVSFDNGIQFGSLFSEPIVTEILRDQGLTVHRANYARLYVNDEYQGVYVNVERIDASFIETKLPDKDGALWKVDMGGPAGNLGFIGNHAALYRRTFETKSDAAKKHADQLDDFIRFINQAPPDQFTTELNSRLATQDFLKTTAVLLFAGAFDQLTGWNPHNYYLFYDTKRKRWHYLPWDLDVGFSETAFGRIHVLEDWNAAWPIPDGTQNPLLERIIADPQLLAEYRRTAKTILDRHFKPETLWRIVDEKYALIKDHLTDDPFPHRRVTNPNDRSYEDIVRSIKDFIRKRYTSAQQQLDNPGPRPQPKNRPGHHGLPPQLAERLQKIIPRAEQMQRNGQDVTPIREIMRKVGPLVQAGRFKEAEQLLDQALKLVK